MRKQTLPSTREQLRLLKQKKIVTKDGRNPSSGKKIQSKWTIYRLYKYYITDKNPVSQPVFKAYAQQKKTYQRIEASPEKTRISTPRGRLTGSEYIKTFDKQTSSRIERNLPDNVSIRFGRFYKTVQHVRDEFIYNIRPPIVANNATQGRAERRSEKAVDDIIQLVRTLYKQRKRLYGNHALGGVIKYRTHNLETTTGVTNPEGHIRVAWVRLPDIDLFRLSLLEAFETAISIVNNYPNSTISIRRVDVYLSTVFRGTNIDFSRL